MSICQSKGIPEILNIVGYVQGRPIHVGIMTLQEIRWDTSLRAKHEEERRIASSGEITGIVCNAEFGKLTAASRVPGFRCLTVNAIWALSTWDK